MIKMKKYIILESKGINGGRTGLMYDLDIKYDWKKIQRNYVIR
jgi:hypothetical protein